MEVVKIEAAEVEETDVERAEVELVEATPTRFQRVKRFVCEKGVKILPTVATLGIVAGAAVLLSKILNTDSHVDKVDDDLETVHEDDPKDKSEDGGVEEVDE